MIDKEKLEITSRLIDTEENKFYSSINKELNKDDYYNYYRRVELYVHNVILLKSILKTMAILEKKEEKSIINFNRNNEIVSVCDYILDLFIKQKFDIEFAKDFIDDFSIILDDFYWDNQEYVNEEYWKTLLILPYINDQSSSGVILNQLDFIEGFETNLRNKESIKDYDSTMFSISKDFTVEFCLYADGRYSVYISKFIKMEDGYDLYSYVTEIVQTEEDTIKQKKLMYIHSEVKYEFTTMNIYKALSLLGILYFISSLAANKDYNADKDINYFDVMEEFINKLNETKILDKIDLI